MKEDEQKPSEQNPQATKMKDPQAGKIKQNGPENTLSRDTLHKHESRSMNNSRRDGRVNY